MQVTLVIKKAFKSDLALGIGDDVEIRVIVEPDSTIVAL